jgi:choice-of-anchor C domain-containing protein
MQINTSLRSRRILYRLIVPAIAGLSLTSSAPCRASANLIVNGGFEQPTPLPFSFGEEFNAGSTGIPGWTVVSGSVDVTPTTWFNSYQGVQALDLDGSSPGAVSQSFVTTIGTAYQLSFAYADNGTAGGTYDGTRTADVTVTDSGGTILLSSSVSHNGSTPDDMNYQIFTGSFVADTMTTTLQFTSTDPSSSNDGIALDAVTVSVSSVPEPGSLILLVAGLSGALVHGWRRPKKVY